MKLFPVFPVGPRPFMTRTCASVHTTGNTGNTGNLYIYLFALLCLLPFPVTCIDRESPGIQGYLGQPLSCKSLVSQALGSPLALPSGLPGLGLLSTQARRERSAALEGVKVRRPASQALFWCATNRHAWPQVWLSGIDVSATSASKLLDLGKPCSCGGLRGSSRRGSHRAGALGDSVEFLWVKVAGCAVRTACTTGTCAKVTGVRHG